MKNDDRTLWWRAQEKRVHESLIPYVKGVERRQSDYFDRFLMYEAQYDPNGPAAEMAELGYRKRLRGIKENVVAIAVDTVRASIAATEIRARFMTDGADWSTQRRAMDLELYAEQMGKSLGVAPACEEGHFAASKKGTGLIKVYADEDGQIHVEPTMVDNIIVDDRECLNGAMPRQMHYRQADFDCDLLIQQFPDAEANILRARGNTSSGWRRPRGQTGDTRNDVLVIESWRLPMGVRGSKGYVPGRHVICIEGADLLDEEWHKQRFPFSVCRYFKREGSWYGGSLTERIIGHQNVLDRRNLQRDRQLDLAVPTMFVDFIDANLSVLTTQAGNVIAHKGNKPQMVVPTVVGPEIANDRLDARSSAIAEIGLSEMATRGSKPAGLQSGASLREFRDQNSQRFSMQEKEFERFWLDTIELILDTCKDLGDAAPQLARQTRFGTRTVKWSDVDMGDVHVQIAAASTLARTPAGRVQTVLELTQAGALNLDELRKLLDHPDLRKTNSLYTASMEAIEEDLESIERGEYVLPEPFVNLEMAQVYANNRYLIDRGQGADEEVLEGLRAYAVTAANMIAQNEAAATSGMMPDGSAPVMPMLPPGSHGPSDPMGGPPMPMPQQVPSAGPPSLPAPASPAAA